MPKKKKKKKDTENVYTAEVTMTKNMLIDFYSSTPKQAKKDAMILAKDDDWKSSVIKKVYGVKWVKASKKKK